MFFSHLRPAAHRVPHPVSNPELDGVIVAAGSEDVSYGVPAEVPDGRTVVGVLDLGASFLGTAAVVEDMRRGGAAMAEAAVTRWGRWYRRAQRR